MREHRSLAGTARMREVGPLPSHAPWRDYPAGTGQKLGAGAREIPVPLFRDVSQIVFLENHRSNRECRTGASASTFPMKEDLPIPVNLLLGSFPPTPAPRRGRAIPLSVLCKPPPSVFQVFVKAHACICKYGCLLLSCLGITVNWTTFCAVFCHFLLSTQHCVTTRTYIIPCSHSASVVPAVAHATVEPLLNSLTHFLVCGHLDTSHFRGLDQSSHVMNMLMSATCAYMFCSV